jgi:rubredoxin
MAPKEPEAPPKGILKAPRPAFPEEPNPVREGVAPLKDAHKQGIPPGARWTKIDRRLVNPEALEAGNERFEERSDYVIVLRVLAKEEIQAYAIKTQEIRGKSRCLSVPPERKGFNYVPRILTLNGLETRHKEYLRDKRQHRDETQRHGRRGEDSSSDDEDEGEDEAPKQLEAPPASDPQKLSLPMRPHASSHSLPEPDRPGMSPSVVPA